MKVEDIPKVNPEISNRYSQNLYRWLCAHQDKDHRFQAWRDEEGVIFLGSPDGKWFHGLRIKSILCEGLRASSWAYRKDLEPYPEFWDLYIKVGRCAIDTEHLNFMQNNEGRFSVAGNERTCTWCGHKQRLVTWEETVTRERWENVEEVTR